MKSNSKYSSSYNFKINYFETQSESIILILTYVWELKCTGKNKILLLRISLHLFFFFNFYGLWLLYNVILVCTVQQKKSVIHIHIVSLFTISFPLSWPQSIEQSSLCYTVCSHQLSILYMLVYTWQSQSPNPSHPQPLTLHLPFIVIFSYIFLGTILHIKIISICL